MARKSADKPVNVVRRVLQADEVRFGPQRVQLLDDRVRRLHGEAAGSLLQSMSFFRVVTDSLWSSVDDLMVVFASPETVTENRMDLVRRVAEELPNCKTITCVKSGDHEEDVSDDATRMPCEVTWLAPDELFHKLFSLPESFAEQLRDSAGIQRPDEFLSVFQGRRAGVHIVAGREPQEHLVELADYFETWLGAHARSSPILLLGERGTGKSWQLLHFAQTAYALHRKAPWKYGPAFFVKLRDLVNTVEDSSGATPILSQYIFERHPDIQTAFGGAAMLGALLGIGHTVVCVDGFDEMDQLPNDSRVRARLTTLLLLLSKRTRFILSSRAGHFSSLSGLLHLQAWSGASVGSTFEVLELLPFDDQRKVQYIRDTGTPEPDSIADLLGLQRATNEDPLKRALSICAGHPGLLAHLKDEIGKGRTAPLELISEAILAILIEFNLRHSRTREKYRLQGSGPETSEWVDLSAPRRVELLSDLAWYMAERGLDAIDLEHLPPRLRLTYGIEDDALRRDLRSQTVLELVDSWESRSSSSDGPGTRTDGYDMTEPSARVEGTGVKLVAVPDVAQRQRVESESPVRFTLRDARGTGQGVGESSIAGAYFLSWYLADRLTETGPFGEMPTEVQLCALGRVRIGPTAGAMLRELLVARECPPRALGQAAWRLFRGLAGIGGFRVYNPWYRHLAANLARIGGLTKSETNMVDPWKEPVAAIVHPPRMLPDYEMVLVSAPPAVSGRGSRAFLLGVHEVTNKQYLDFVLAPADDVSDSTVCGLDWSVGRMTVAGSGQRGSLSSNHLLSNEYHLFFWLPTGRRSSEESANAGNDDTVDGYYRPPPGILKHPVTYVSWYAAAALCDWLSFREGDLGRYYESEFAGAPDSPRKGAAGSVDLEDCGYRLPSREEWRWAARGGHEDVQRPWEMFPYFLPRELREAEANGQAGRIVNVGAWKKYKSAQGVVRDVLLDSGKRASDVLYDELNDFGLSGLVGNVREWCEDHPSAEDVGEDSARDQRLILGATGYLGESTFDFEYQTPLYPRNTNPDVGFRVARSLTQSETDILRRRETEIAALAEGPPLDNAAEHSREDGST